MRLSGKRCVMSSFALILPELISFKAVLVSMWDVEYDGIILISEKNSLCGLTRIYSSGDVGAKRQTVPPLRQTFIPSNKALTFGAVTMTASDPLPLVASLTISARSSLYEFTAKSAPNLLAIFSLGSW